MTIQNVQLHPVDFSSPETRASIVSFLTPYVPYTLPILGSIFHTPPANVYFWTSFEYPLKEKTVPPAPPLFSTVFISNIQCRFFCSAELSPKLGTPEEETHVINALQAFIRCVTAADRDSILDGYRLENPAGIKLGSIHDKWFSCLQPYITRVGSPCTKFLLSPQNAMTAAESSMAAGDAQWVVSQLTESDIETVQSTSHISRSREYLSSRCPTSACLRTRTGRPVAWVLMHSDGSIGTLHVESDYRRQGLAQLALQELVKRLHSMPANEWCGDHAGGGALGWNSVDVVGGNDAAHGFFRSLDSWKEGWVSHWMLLREVDGGRY